jgi:hypothetical protein
MMQNAAKISPTNFRVTSVLGTKRERDETARGRNDHKAMQLPENTRRTSTFRAKALYQQVKLQVSGQHSFKAFKVEVKSVLRIGSAHNNVRM